MINDSVIQLVDTMFFFPPELSAKSSQTALFANNSLTGKCDWMRKPKVSDKLAVFSIHIMNKLNFSERTKKNDS